MAVDRLVVKLLFSRNAPDVQPRDFQALLLNGDRKQLLYNAYQVPT